MQSKKKSCSKSFKTNICLKSKRVGFVPRFFEGRLHKEHTMETFMIQVPQILKILIPRKISQRKILILKTLGVCKRDH